LGGIQDRYLRYEAAGDQYLGRVAAGLPLNKAEFATLAPYFDNRDHKVVRESTERMFPMLRCQAQLIDVLRLCLASLVYHACELKKMLPSKHPLLGTFIFREPNVLIRLGELVTISDSDFIHVQLYKQQQLTHDAVERLPSILLSKMENLIEEKGVCAGNITHDLLKTTIRDLVRDLGLGLSFSTTPEPDSTLASNEFLLHHWGGRLHILPEDFEFPAVDTYTAWKLWWFGNKSKKYPPFKSINTCDLSSRRKQQTYSSWKVMMQYLIQSIKDATNKPISDKPTEKEIEKMYDIAKRHLPIEHATRSKRKRRSTQLKMVTALRLIRESKR
jgi:hypothetical protein